MTVMDKDSKGHVTYILYKSSNPISNPVFLLKVNNIMGLDQLDKIQEIKKVVRKGS